MEPVTGFISDEQADQYFASLNNPTPALIDKIARERQGDIAAIVTEGKTYGYWERKVAARATRRAAREAAELAQRAERFALLHRAPDESARLPPLPGTSIHTLPEPRVVTITDAERTETQQWWRRLTTHLSAGQTLAMRFLKEARDAGIAERRAARAAAAWRLDQRAFERAQWRSAIAPRLTRPARKWSAIDEHHALEIAIRVLENQHPPQGAN